jgi:hypothetical protein
MELFEARVYIKTLEKDRHRMRVALEKIIEMNQQYAEDEFGDSDKAETWAWVVTARAALSGEKEERRGH